jgi:hypothetical protein
MTDAWPAWNFVDPTEFNPDAAERAQQPEIGSRPKLGDGDNPRSRQHQRRKRRDNLNK